jgi:thioredoxin-related protein
MSRLIWILFLANVVLVLPLAAQDRGVRLGSSAMPQTNLVPADKAAKVNTRPNDGAQPSVKERTATNAAQTQTVFGNPQRKPAQTGTAAGRPARPSDTYLRPATYAPPPTAHLTAKDGASGQGSVKAKSLKKAEPAVVNWMTIEQALERSKTEKKKIFLDLYTDWCGWCKHMDSTTFVNPAVVNYLNEHYYPVKFNAEQERDIVFKDKTYKFKKNGTRGCHELAAFWLNNRLSFPTVVFLDENQQPIQSIPGYQDATKMEAIIHYFGSDSHKKTPWESYEKNFESANRR